MWNWKAPASKLTYNEFVVKGVYTAEIGFVVRVNVPVKQHLATRTKTPTTLRQ
jgi:hypothetical protein